MSLYLKTRFIHGDLNAIISVQEGQKVSFYADGSENDNENQNEFILNIKYYAGTTRVENLLSLASDTSSVMTNCKGEILIETNGY